MDTQQLEPLTPPTKANDELIETTKAINNETEALSIVGDRPVVWPAAFVEDFSDSTWPQFDQDDESIRSWTMKEKKLLLRVITWNLCAKPPPSVDIFRQELLLQRFHLYVVGTEECERSIAQSALITSKKNWEAYLKEGLGEAYIPLRSHTLQAIHIMAFAHRSIASFCSIVTSGAVATGAGNTLGNKGAVSVFVKIAKTRILVTNAHLSAHQGAEKRRNAEFYKISRQMPALLRKKESSLGLDDSAALSVGGTSNAAQVNSAELGSSADSLGGESPPAVVTSNNLQAASSNVKPATSQHDKESVIADERTTKESTTEPENAPPPVAGDVIVTAVLNEDDDEDDEDPNTLGALDKDSPVVDSFTGSAVPSGKDDVKTLDQIADMVIFMGDLNYRINGNRSIIDKLLAANMHDVLINNDQLTANMKKGLVFEKYVEPPLNFKPTYKFDVGSDSYDSGSKKRIPSWTDRILYVPSDSCHCLAYNSANTIKTSDHRPVYASFLLNLNTFVSLDDNQNAVVPAKVEFTSESQVCTIS